MIPLSDSRRDLKSAQSAVCAKIGFLREVPVCADLRRIITRLLLVAMIKQLRKKHIVGIGGGELVLHSSFQSFRLFFSSYFAVKDGQLQVQLQVIAVARARLCHWRQELYRATLFSLASKAWANAVAAM